MNWEVIAEKSNYDKLVIQNSLGLQTETIMEWVDILREIKENPIGALRAMRKLT